MSKIYQKLMEVGDERKKEQKAGCIEMLVFWAVAISLCAYFWYIVSYALLRWLLGV